MKLFLYFLGACLLLLVVLLFFTPTLISTKQGQQIALRWINRSISGKVEVKAWNLGWFSGQKLEEFKFYDKNGALIAGVDFLETEETLASLVLGRYHLGNTTAKNPYLHYSEEAPGVTNIKKALSKRPVREKQPTESSFSIPRIRGNIQIENGTAILEWPGAAAITVSHVSVASNSAEKALHVTGDIDQGGVKGTLLIEGSGKENPHLFAQVDSFPVSFFDGIAQTTLFTKALGSKVDLHLDIERQETKATVALDLKSTNLNGQLAGTTSNGILNFDPKSRLVFTVTPTLFQEFVQEATWSLASKTNLTLSFEQLSIPLKTKRIRFKDIQMQGTISIDRSEIAEKKVGNFSLNDFSLHFTNKDAFLIDYNGTILSPFGITQMKGSAKAINRNHLTFSGDWQGFPLPLIDLLTKKTTEIPAIFGNQLDLTYNGFYENGRFHVDLDLLSTLLHFKGTVEQNSLQGTGEIFVPKQYVTYIGPNPQYDLQATYHFEKRKIVIPTFAAHVTNPYVTVDVEGQLDDALQFDLLAQLSSLPALRPFEKGELTFTFDACKDKASGQLQFSSPKLLSSAFQSAVEMSDFVKEGHFDFKNATYKVEGKGSDFPVETLATLLKTKLPLESLIGKTVDFDYNGLYRLTAPQTEPKASICFTLKGEGVHADLCFSRDGVFKLGSEQPSYIHWNLTPERYLNLKQHFHFNTQSSFRLKQNAAIDLKLKDFVCPISTKTENFFAECGLVGEFSIEPLIYVSDSKSEISFTHVQGMIHGQDFSKQLFVDLKGDILAPNIPATQKAGFTFTGEVLELVTEAGELNNKKLKVKGDLALNLLPIRQILGLMPLEESARKKVHAILGDLLNARIYGEIQEMKGPLTVDIKATNFKTLLPLYLENNVIGLRETVTAELTLTPEVSDNFLRDINPLIITGAWSNHPVKLTIEPRGFAIPINPFSLSQVTIERAVIDLGAIQIRNGGGIQSLMSFLKAKEISQDGVMRAWFTPIYLTLKNGVVSYRRFDILLAENVHIALWGGVDLVNDRVSMVLGISEATLAERFNVRGLNKKDMFQVKMRGSTSNVEMDWSSAYTRIGILITKGTAGGLGLLIGGIVEQIVNSLGEEQTPPPSTSPFPWER